MNREEPAKFGSIDSFLHERARVRGTVEIDLHGLPLHFFFDWRDAPVTLVTFSGTVSAKAEHVPAWAGDGISRGLGMNRVLISDPTIKLSTDLRLGWYAGSAHQPRLQDEIAYLLSEIRGDADRMLLFGPSGGGFAALLQAAELAGSTALVSNPQTDITKFTRPAVERYLARGWEIDELLFRESLPFVHEVITLYSGPGHSRTIYLQNAGDADHIEKHYAPFRRAIHPTRSVEFLLPNLGAGHIGPDRESFTRLLTVMRDVEVWEDVVASLGEIGITRNL